MRTRIVGYLALVCLPLLSATDAKAVILANRVFVSARSGNDANACDNIATPCKTFVGAVTKLNPNGTVIVLDSGGYGPVTITQGVTIEAPAGVTAFIHPPSGDAITVNAGSATVTLRGLVLNGDPGGSGHGITVNAVGSLNVENCVIATFGFHNGIQMFSGGRLNVKGTDIRFCNVGILIFSTSSVAKVSIDHCHLDTNGIGFLANTVAPGASTTTASYTTANNCSGLGWHAGDGTTGKDVLNLENCTGSENDEDGLRGGSSNAQSAVRYSNCVFANNGRYGVAQENSGTVESRGNNTITGNGTAPTFGIIGTFPPM